MIYSTVKKGILYSIKKGVTSSARMTSNAVLLHFIAAWPLWKQLLATAHLSVISLCIHKKEDGVAYTKAFIVQGCNIDFIWLQGKGNYILNYKDVSVTCQQELYGPSDQWLQGDTRELNTPKRDAAVTVDLWFAESAQKGSNSKFLKPTYRIGHKLTHVLCTNIHGAYCTVCRMETNQVESLHKLIKKQNNQDKEQVMIFK